MGGVCSCFRVEDFEEYINPSSSVYRNCPCLRCLAHNFLNVYISLFRRGETRSLPSSLQSPASITSSASHDNFLSDAFRSTPRPLPYDADPRYFRSPRDSLVSRREKGSNHSHEESEPLRSNNSVDSESFGGGGGKRASQSVLEDGSKEEYSKSTLRILQSKTKAGTESMYILSEDEDVCPTCLEEYTLENPKIVTKCSHHFHLGCIYEWMERSENCPVCGKVMEFNETP
ncbi:PREDICTED: E3 ubiquitin-protein ligase At3g02290-like isoform X1 [Tarenaya hassleriana]|uniref:RING-type E3 ubiquitin transferase n=1 Tax=Tarenaya spinosa TaxID=228870 RepID=Q1KUU2_9ROSI|nr:PREDICTED: E3 ubiquitin-protein ligase At3g02290-like isoform X1 [Tarenaya hassleriana]XP_010558518.1 PREDICTED: E3 ubiquitin-protein ligase At3g02290-like isoform X1 [Tarenaya hassleriana]XP_010558519.1 PREDICTED: E3 ubiquitin-protein ligase At3g02290-like isoform X1 [Tarenaya hassleriana]XP_010558520.1 PREDICTED: E3 ubiquitin-protein ligase At3g02290-like isoform X1 [Tarenaya hassleriana]XP_010558522.1 PREDICTED: E3 ubiquitin-protein ligase At3g02290-like isoform X1 [Tarenaya hassleriana]